MRLLQMKNKVVTIMLSIALALVIDNTWAMAEVIDTTVTTEITDNLETVNMQQERLNFYSKTDEAIARSLATEFELELTAVNQMKESNNTWIDIYQQLIIKRKHDITLNYKAVVDMRQKGIKVDDIVKAELLSAVSGLTIEELLLAKGSTSNYKIDVQENEDGSISYKTIDLRDELWSKVIEDLKIDMELIIIKMGVAYEDIQQMREANYSDYMIFNMAYTAMEYHASYKKIQEDILNGTSLKKVISRLKRNKFYNKEGK